MASQNLGLRQQFLSLGSHRSGCRPFQPAAPSCSAARARCRIRPALAACSCGNEPSMDVAMDRRQLLLAAAAASGLRMMAAQWPAQAAECQLQTTASGLQWCDLVVGDGATAAAGTLIKTHFTGSLAKTGTVFESSYKRNQPLIIKVGEHEALEAWDMALLGTPDMPAMREGGKRRLVVPPGPLQRQGTKSLIWVVGLSEALEEADELSPSGTPMSALIFDLEYVPKRRRKG